jgi:hypothetical protein
MKGKAKNKIKEINGKGHIHNLVCDVMIWE